jgi:hypothetical protein
MQRLAITITGLSPLLCGRPAEPGRPEEEPHDVAARRLYLNDAGQPCIPASNVFRCICNAARFLDRGTAEVIAALLIEEADIAISSDAPWTVDARSVRQQGSRERSICYRPCFDHWRLSFVLQVDTGLIDCATAIDLLNLAGRRIGLGDYRTERGGPFGRFEVTNHEAL